MDKKKLAIIGGIAAVVIIGAVIAVVVANSGKSDDKGGDKGGTSQQTDKDGDKKDGDDKKSKTITADDLKTVDEIINYGDYEAQETLSKAIQNGEKDGKVVKIEGTVSHFGSGMSYNIGQRRQNGNAYIGTTFTIEDGADADYPKDGDHVTITGIVVADESGLVHTIKTLKDFVKIVEK